MWGGRRSSRSSRSRSSGRLLSSFRSSRGWSTTSRLPVSLLTAVVAMAMTSLHVSQHLSGMVRTVSGFAQQRQAQAQPQRQPQHHRWSNPSFPSSYLVTSAPTPSISRLFGSKPTNTGRGKQDEEDRNAAVEVEYQSRSTSDPEASTRFYEGSDDRKTRLHDALRSIGVLSDKEEEDVIFWERPEVRGSAALRSYRSFVWPKSEGALAVAQQPQRSAVVANHINFLLREHASHQQEWLRNHDRSLQEAEAKWAAAAADAATAATTGPSTPTSSTSTASPSPSPFPSLRHPIILVLDNVRSAHNVGNILRFAEAARCDQVVLCGSMTPSPPHPKVLKTALGAAEYVPYATVGSTLQAIRNLKDENVRVYGVETTTQSLPLWKVSFFSVDADADAATTVHIQDNNSTVSSPRPPRIAFVFGNELVGVGVDVLKECDGGIIAVPTHGIKNSLNIATCASVVTWEALRQWELHQEQQRIDEQVS